MVKRKIWGAIAVTALAAPLAFADVPVAGFADAGYTFVDNDKNATDNKSQNNFLHGQFDLYYTKKLDDKVSFLAEVVNEISDENEAVLDLERLYVQYYVSPWLQISLGRTHTALGYWNDNYHHGSWLQTTVERPQMYRFEDDGGILPVHAAGLEFRGQGQLGAGEFGYIANIANGRGPEVDPPQIVNDANGDKALNAVVFYELNGFRFGATYYMDKMPGTSADNEDVDGDNATDDAELHNKGNETIYGAHLYMNRFNVELLSEVLFVKHEYKTKGALDAAGSELNQKDNTVMGGYVQVGYMTGSCTPYLRYDTVKNDKGMTDAYTGVDSVTTNYSIGNRYELTRSSALKIEGTLTKNRGLETKQYTANWSFAW